jgi:hypothetical protein
LGIGDNMNLFPIAPAPFAPIELKKIPIVEKLPLPLPLKNSSTEYLNSEKIEVKDVV